MRHDELPDRWVIRFRDGVKDKDATKILKEHGRTAHRKCHVAKGKQRHGRGHKLELRNITEQHADKLRKRGEITLVEKSVRCGLFSTIPNDTRWSEQWALNPSATVGGAPVTGHAYGPTGWDYDTGGSIIVAVVDTGVDYTHPDLAANMWNDGMGHIGHSFTPSGEGNDGAPPVGPHGAMYHGTHVAGIIGAVGDNARGVTGVCWTCKIMPIQIFYWYYDSWGQVNWTLDTVDAADAVEWAVDNGAKVINHSWGGGGYAPQHLLDAWEYAADNDVTCVCASGNNGKPNDVWAMIPCGIKTENNIAVNSNTHDNEMSFFTNYGIASTHIYAPGGNAYGSTDEQNILSTMPDGEYAKLAGTSMAAPHITGAIALARTYYDPTNGHLPNSWVRRLLAACIRPAEPYFMTSEYGGRLDLERLLYHITAGQGIHLESVSDVSIQPDLDDPAKSVLTWTNPGMAGFLEVYISRQEGSFPEPRLGSVAPVVKVYEGTDETCEDTGVTAGVIYGYKFETVYNISGIKFALPVYVRSLAGWAPFVCPVAPVNFEFICDYWDETWYPIEGVPLFECHNLAQLWRAVTSKNMTAEVNQIAGLPFTFRPGAIFRHYDVVDTYPFPTVPEDPQPTHCGKHEIIKHGAIFIEDLLKNVQFLLGGFTLTSRKWPERGLMVYRWLDYYYYVTTGKVKAWEPGDSNILNWTSEDCKDREKWQDILSDCRHALHNMRVLFTGIPPWNTFMIQTIVKQDRSDPATIDYQEHTTVDYDVPWSPGVEDPADPELDATAPVSAYIGDKSFVKFMLAFAYSVIDGVWAMVDQHTPRYHLERESFTFHLWKYVKAMFADWTIIADLQDDYEPDFGSPWYGQAAGLTFSERPSIGEEVNNGWSWDDLYTMNAGIGAVGATPYPVEQTRVITVNNGILQCGQNWDWENEPVVFDAWVLIKSYASDAHNWLINAESMNALPDVYPDDDEIGFLTITVHLPAIMGGGTRDFTINPAQLYHQGGIHIKLGSFTVDDPNDLRHEFSITMNMPHDTLPAYSYCKVHNCDLTAYTDWWGEAWSGQENVHDWSLDIEAPSPVAHSLVNRYCVTRSNAITAYINLTSHWPVPEQKKCPYVPDLRGMHIQDDAQAIEDVCDKVGLEFAATTDDTTNYQEHYETNSTLRVINQTPVQGMLKYTHNPNDPAIGADKIKWTAAAYEGNTEETIIPKVVGLTVEEAWDYLAANFPDWELDEGYWTQVQNGTDVFGNPIYEDVWNSNVTLQLCNHRYPGQITGQNPDWRIRQARFAVGGGKKLSITISGGFTEGAAMCKGFVGRNINDLDVQADIQALLDYDPATPIYTTYQYLLDSDRPTGTIMAQSPPKYSVFPRTNPGNLKLLVAVKWDEETPKQTPPHDWPDLRGMTLAEAQAECAGKYTVSTHGRVYSQRAAGLIVSQSPRPIYKTAFSPEQIYVCISAGLFNCDDLLRCETKP